MSEEKNNFSENMKQTGNIFMNIGCLVMSLGVLFIIGLFVWLAI